MGLYREYQRVAEHPKVAARAKARPGQWQRVGVYRHAETARAIAIQVRKGALSSYAPGGHFQAYRSVGFKGRALWVRYVHGITPGTELPEQLPEAARVVMAAHFGTSRYLSARWAADQLAAQGHAEDADRIHAWLAETRDGRTSARQAAAYLLQFSTTREDAAQ
jgi:hypothetical protein